MKSFCLKCRKNTEIINPRASTPINGRTMLLSKYVICDSKKSRFIKNGVRTPLIKVPILGDILL